MSGGELQRLYAVQQGVLWSRATIDQLERTQAAVQAAAATAVDRPQHIDHEYQLVFIRMRYEVHFWIVAARNMVRAVELLKPHVPESELGLPASLAQHVAIVRNCLEHFDKHNPFASTQPAPKLSRKTFVERFPGQHPENLELNSAGDCSIGGIDSRTLAIHAEHLYGLFRELDESWFVHHGWDRAWPNGRSL